MAAYNKFQVFVQDVMNAKHDLHSADQVTIALSVNATPPVATNTVLANLTQIAYTNLSSRNVTRFSSGHTTGTYKLIMTDHVLTASGAVATFRWVSLYNSTALNGPLICYFDHGSDVTLANAETYTLDFDGTNGLFTLV